MAQLAWRAGFSRLRKVQPYCMVAYARNCASLQIFNRKTPMFIDDWETIGNLSPKQRAVFEP